MELINFKTGKLDIKSLSLTELKAQMEQIGEKSFRAKQLYEWMHQKMARDYAEMTNIPKTLKEKLEEHYSYTSLKEVCVQTSKIDGTKKFLFALSLHGATQEKRCRLMPIANQYPLDSVMEACQYYFVQTGRRVTFEYSLVGGVNDTEEDARNLCRLISRYSTDYAQPFHVNLIPVNPIKERNFVESDKREILNFKNKLEKKHINVTIRREMGRDIDGACGQLRRHILYE